MQELEVSIPFVIIEHDNKFVSNFAFLVKFIIAELTIDRLCYFLSVRFSAAFNLSVFISTLLVFLILYTTGQVKNKLRQQKVFRKFIIFFKENNLQSKVSEKDFKDAKFICLKEDGNFKIFKNTDFATVYDALIECATNERLVLYFAIASLSVCGIVSASTLIIFSILAIVFFISSYYISRYVRIQKQIFN